jgi:threonyl-tRNA synthetase
MFQFESEEQRFGLKPMNCPGHFLLYGSELHSYRDLPIRLHDQGVLHRNEASGTLGGLTRVRQFSQDDAHIFVTPAQVPDEVKRLIDMVDRVYRAFDLKYQVKISTRNPEKYMGDLAVWDAAEKALEEVMKEKGLDYRIEPGEAAFYGPKIDYDVTDALGRKWQCATIQLDFQQPENFKLEYIGEDNTAHRPVVIHRAIYGSFERFIALLIEHYAGAFPLWLSPVHARVVVVSEKHEQFAKEALAELRSHGLRVDVDVSNDKLGAKIRRAQLEKIPYMLVIGDKEVAARTVAPRSRDGKQHDPMALDAFAAKVIEESRVPLRQGNQSTGK